VIDRPNNAKRCRPGRCPTLATIVARSPVVGGCVLALLLAILGVGSLSLSASQNDGFINREYPLKALFLYNFAGYVEWHESAFQADDESFVIGVVGSAPIDGMLREIAATKSIAGRRIAVKQFGSADQIERCHILFVARNVPKTEQARIIGRLRGLPVLTVGEVQGFAAQGGCVNFYIESNKIRFEINLEAARQQQLRISAKLLALAKIVE
jgi:hypothetical protein